MAKIFAPNKTYNGTSATVKFENGVGETSDPNLITWFQERGYSVEKDNKTTDANKTDVANENTRPRRRNARS